MEKEPESVSNETDVQHEEGVILQSERPWPEGSPAEDAIGGESYEAYCWRKGIKLSAIEVPKREPIVSPAKAAPVVDPQPDHKPDPTVPEPQAPPRLDQTKTIPPIVSTKDIPEKLAQRAALKKEKRIKKRADALMRFVFIATGLCFVGYAIFLGAKDYHKKHTHDSHYEINRFGPMFPQEVSKFLDRYYLYNFNHEIIRKRHENQALMLRRSAKETQAKEKAEHLKQRQAGGTTYADSFSNAWSTVVGVFSDEDTDSIDGSTDKTRIIDEDGNGIDDREELNMIFAQFGDKEQMTMANFYSSQNVTNSAGTQHFYLSRMERSVPAPKYDTSPVAYYAATDSLGEELNTINVRNVAWDVAYYYFLLRIHAPAEFKKLSTQYGRTKNKEEFEKHAINFVYNSQELQKKIAEEEQKLLQQNGFDAHRLEEAQKNDFKCICNFDLGIYSKFAFVCNPSWKTNFGASFPSHPPSVCRAYIDPQIEPFSDQMPVQKTTLEVVDPAFKAIREELATHLGIKNPTTLIMPRQLNISYLEFPSTQQMQRFYSPGLAHPLELYLRASHSSRGVRYARKGNPFLQMLDYVGEFLWPGSIDSKRFRDMTYFRSEQQTKMDARRADLVSVRVNQIKDEKNKDESLWSKLGNVPLTVAASAIEFAKGSGVSCDKAKRDWTDLTRVNNSYLLQLDPLCITELMQTPQQTRKAQKLSGGDAMCLAHCAVKNDLIEVTAYKRRNQMSLTKTMMDEIDAVIAILRDVEALKVYTHKFQPPSA